MNVLNFKHKYLSEHSYHQFILLNEDLQIIDTCNTLWNFTHKIRKNITEVFPFIENIKEAILSQEELFFPKIDLSFDKSKPQIYDFFFKKEQTDEKNFILCIIKDVLKMNDEFIHSQQMARLAMLEKDYLETQNKNFSLENELLQNKNSELEQSKELRNLFFSKISHELRSPVNGILGLSQIILEQEQITGELKNYMEGILVSAKHLRTILDDILDVSKIEAGGIKIQKEPFQLHSIFQNLRLNFLHILELKKLSLHIHIAADVPLLLLGDEVRLTQILHNLLSNAIKFTEKGSIWLRVKLHKTENALEYLVFQVEDSGVGMSKADIDCIFEPYKQTGKQKFQYLGSTGLGLSVVKQLIELQNGSINVESQPHKGTVFQFTLPFEKQNDNLQIAKESYQQRFYALTALIVDDSNISRIYAKKLLEDVGFIVKTTDSSTEGLELLLQNNYDLCITDLNLPDMNGDLMIEKYRERCKTPETSFLFATGSLGIRKIYYPSLIKPFSSKELMELLIQVIPKEKQLLHSWEYLLKITDNNQNFLKELVESFVVSCKEDIQTLEEAIQDKNIQAITKVLHKIKPIATLMGSQVLSRSVQYTEKIINQNSQTSVEIEKQVKMIILFIQIAITFFKNSNPSKYESESI
ncbi:MAG: ATP-binding protein [Thermonemataceae bacterium]|nr:ATP-binding protein [Thermonemataceae bacterium]